LIQQSIAETMLGAPAYKEELNLRKLQQVAVPPGRNKKLQKVFIWRTDFDLPLELLQPVPNPR
jgi:hypothetical protein